MYKLAVVLFALVAVTSAGLVAPLISGVSHTQRIQSHVPVGVVGGVVPVVGKVGLGLGGVGIGGLGLGGLGVVNGLGVASPLGLGLGVAGVGPVVSHGIIG